MTINDIDFAQLYMKHMQRAQRTRKTPEHWDSRAEKLALIHKNQDDQYLTQLISYLDLTDAKTLLDVGCGPGSIALRTAKNVDQVYGIDYSTKMIEQAQLLQQQSGVTNAKFLRLAWEDSWSDIPICDVSIASRSTLVDDLEQALYKLNQHTKLRVYSTHPVHESFVTEQIMRAINRDYRGTPSYIYAVNILYKHGIHPEIKYIPGKQQTSWQDYAEFEQSISWALNGLTEAECASLKQYYQNNCNNHAKMLVTRRDWALLSWQPKPW